MKVNIIFITILVLSVVTFSCKDDNTPPTAPSYYYGDSHACVELMPTLIWNPSIDADNNSIEYTLMMGKTEGTLSVIASKILLHSYTFRTPLEANTTYFWQVMASDGEEEVFGDIWNFSTVIDPIEIVGPTAAKLNIPEVMSFASDGNAYSVFFSWTASEPADNVTYTLCIDPLGDNQANPHKVEGIVNPQILIDLPGGSWEWYVEVVDDKGNVTKSHKLVLALE